MAVHLNPNQIEEMFEKYKESGDIEDYGKNLEGQFGKVKDIKYKNKIFAGKIILEDNSQDDDSLISIRGPNIIRLHKICRAKKLFGIIYHLIIMEKAILRDLDKLINFFHRRNILKLKNEFPFDESMEDCLIRYFVKQIIDGLEILDKFNFTYSVRPENVLVGANIILKLSNFKNVGQIKDYTHNMMVKCFTLGQTIFYIKFGKKIFKDNELNIFNMKEKYIDVLLKKISEENKYKIMDRDLIYLLIKLTKCELSFEQIYRNKWLNKNLDYIENVVSNFETDEEKLLNELSKQDFIIKKNKIIEYDTKIINKNFLNNNGKVRKKFDSYLIRKKFRFKKSKKIY